MTGPLWTFADVLAATGGRVEGDGTPDISSVSFDSRTLEIGALFAAIRGDNLDGHDFVKTAFAAGAVAALVAEDADVDALSGPLIRVADTLEALGQLGAAARNRSDAKVIAVTGSVGKTGTKEALRLALGPSGETHASQKSYNNHWGVPLTLANFPPSADYGVFEVGMNHPGEITPLVRLVRPHVAIITTVEPVHLEFFDSVEQIAEAKAEIFLGLEPGGIAILNTDNPHFERLAKRAREAGAGRIVGFGSGDGADARLITMTGADDGSQVDAKIGDKLLSYRVGAAGRHLVMNSLAVLAAVEAVGADLEKAAATLSSYAAPVGRGARSYFELDGGKIALIDESYNANPASMRAALTALGDVPRSDHPRRVAVLGDMLELGETSPELHADLAEPVDAAGVDVVFACGPHMRSLYDALPESRCGAYAENSDGLIRALPEAVKVGDVVMIKGSLGTRMGPLVEALRAHLADRGARAE
ncbi:MAG: UDP-N-acetylmuramoylalanyl-D-glutamyl-2,6-diaminopimelate--D-alanyl-D-alanine ligase [Hyphomicrobiaceae bacterium]|nr:UDP-N-acetylmuramoylalanyl-D-glutamyl-2,6-diaminopimelate--D-alanyl-D-alanine ligase [Hyphomicrobiaceae bacterium]